MKPTLQGDRGLLVALGLVAVLECAIAPPRTVLAQDALSGPPRTPEASAVVDEPMPLPPVTSVIGGGQTLELSVVLDSVDRRHPVLEAGRERVRAAEGEALAADGGFDLTVRAEGFIAPLGYYDWGRGSVTLEQPTPLWGSSFYAGWRIGRGDVPDYYGHQDTLDAGEFRVGARIPLFRDGPTDARRARRGRAAQSTLAEDAALSEQRLSLRRDAVAAYYRWAAAGQRYQIASRLLQIAEARDAQIASKVAAGHLPAIESLENRRVILARRTSLVSARRSLERTAIALSLHLRDAGDSPRVPDISELPTELPPHETLEMELDDAIEEAWQRRPLSARYRALTERQQISRDFAANRRAPQIDLGVGASVDVGTGTMAAQEVLGPAVLEASLSFSLPVQQREARGTVARTEAELAGLSADARYAKDRVEAQLRDAYSAVRAAEERVELAREAAEVATAVARAERTRFDLGATQLFVVNLREEGAAAAAAVLVDAQAEREVAYAEWHAAYGDL